MLRVLCIVVSIGFCTAAFAQNISGAVFFNGRPINERLDAAATAPAKVAAAKKKNLGIGAPGAAEISAVQEALKDRGYDPGPVDGSFGHLTSAALESFEEASGLPVTGAMSLTIQRRLDAFVPETAARFRRSAKLGNASAQNMLGSLYANGQGVEKDEAEAIGWFRRAAEQGHPSAQYMLGVMYSDGRGVEKDEAEAIGWYRQAANARHAGARIALGEMYASGRGVERNLDKAAAWYSGSLPLTSAEISAIQSALQERGYDPGPIDGYYGARTAGAVIEFEEASGLPITGKVGPGIQRQLSAFGPESVERYRLNAAKGDMGAQKVLGDMYAAGDGVEKDEAEAALWYRRAAEQGHASAQNVLGAMYAKGRGVEKDEVEAVRWFRRAAEQGHPSAQLMLGNMYEKGVGIEQDETVALTWYRQAAEQGHARAIEILSRMDAAEPSVE